MPKIPVNNNIVLTTDQLKDLREQCQTIDRLRAVPDLAMTAVGLATAIPGFPVASAFYLTAITGGYSVYRALGFDPAGSVDPLCEAVQFHDKQQNLPNIVVEPPNADLSSVKIDLSTLPVKPAQRSPQSVKENLDKLEVTPDVQAKILKHSSQLVAGSSEFENKLDQAINWQAQIPFKNKNNQSKEGQKASKPAITVQELVDTLGFLNQIGAMTGCKELQQFSTFALSGITIFQNIATLTTSGFALGPIVGIANAVFSIFSLFMNPGPNPTQIILEQISKLSIQMNDMHYEINKQFADNFKVQKQILEMVVYSFNKLSQHIDQRFDSLKTDLKINLQDIQIRLKFLQDQQRLTNIELFLKDFHTAKIQVEQYLQGIYEQDLVNQVQQLSRTLSGWIKEHAKNPVVNGNIFFKTAKDIDMVTSELRNLDEQNLNFYLDFFAQYAPELNPHLSLAPMPNPEVWLTAVQSYIGLQSMFPSLSLEEEDALLNGMITDCQKSIAFFENLSEDTKFWDALLDQYQQSLAQVKITAEQCAAEYSNKERTRLNTDYKFKAIISQTEIKQDEFNLLKKPKELINAFTNKKINSITAIKSNFNRKLTNYKPLHHAFDASFLKPILLAGEYLQLLSFSGEQTADISLPYIPGHIYGNTECGRLYGALCTRMAKVPSRANSNLQAEVGPEFLRKHDDPSQEQKEWALSIDLKVTHENQTDSIASGIFQGNFAAIRVTASILDHTGEKGALDLPQYPVDAKFFPYTKNEQLEEFPLIVTHWSDNKGDEDFYKRKLEKKIPVYIEEEWNKSDKLNLSQKKAGKDVSVAVNDSIEKYFLAHRQQLVAILCNGNDRSTAALVAYRRAITNLNRLALLIYWYGYLTGKDMNDGFFSNLVTEADIIKDLSNFASDKSLPDTWLSCITNIKKLTFAQIEAIPQNKSLPLPARLLKTGLLKLEAYRGWKAIFKKQFPTLSNYVDLQKYQQRLEETRDYMFMRRVEQQFHGLRKLPFHNACLALKPHRQDAISENMMSNELFQAHYTDIFGWSVDESIDSINTAYNDIVIENLSDDQIHALTELHLKHLGWCWSIKSLMNYTKKCADCQLEDSLKPVNFLIWLEGAYSYLDLIVFNPDSRIYKAAENNKTTPKIMINAIKEIAKNGVMLKKILFAIGHSYDLFDQLFNDYLSALNEPLRFIQQLTRQHPAVGGITKDINSTETKLNVYKLLASKAYEGARDTILNQLAVHAVWLRAYLEMTFGYFTQRPTNAKHELLFDGITFKLYTDKDELLKFLQQSNNDNQLDVALEEYMQQIRKLQQRVLVHISYSKDLSLMHKYLEDFSARQKTTPKNTLVISGTLMLFPLVQEKIDLLGKFLHAHREIRALVIDGIALDDEALASLMKVVSGCPWIKALTLSHCGLNLNSLELLESNLGQLPNLKVLNLSGNDFAASKIELMFKLIDLIKKLSGLSHLSLANNGLTNMEVCAISAALYDHHNLIALDLRNNKIPSWETIEPAFINLSKRLTKLKIINLSGNGLQINDSKGTQVVCINKPDIEFPDTQPVIPITPCLNNPFKLIFNERLGQPLLDHMLDLLNIAEQELLKTSVLSNTSIQSLGTSLSRALADRASDNSENKVFNTSLQP